MRSNVYRMVLSFGAGVFAMVASVIALLMIDTTLGNVFGAVMFVAGLAFFYFAALEMTIVEKALNIVPEEKNEDN